MDKITRLKREALESCELRGHVMFGLYKIDDHTWCSECAVCESYAYVNACPAPNETGISGDAVAISCIGFED